jgi:hypothetical protein
LVGIGQFSVANQHSLPMLSFLENLWRKHLSRGGRMRENLLRVNSNREPFPVYFNVLYVCGGNEPKPLVSIISLFGGWSEEWMFLPDDW